MTTQPLTHTILADAVRGGAAAIRARTRLQPAGGPGDKVFPPAFGEHSATSVHALSPIALVFGMRDSTGPKGEAEGEDL